MGRRRPGRHNLSAVMAMAVILALLALVVSTDRPDGDGARSTAASAQTQGRQACPEDRVPASGFDDVAGNTHEASIDCVVWWGIARGIDADRYAPAGIVARGQMASFLARSIEASCVSLPAARDQGFTDIEGSPHAERINQLAQVGIVRGTSANAYSPQRGVTREQMATFLVRTYEYISSSRLGSSRDYFHDDNGRTHEHSTNRAAAAGFVHGTGPREFSPTLRVRRDQMTSFLTRVLDKLVADGHTPRPGGDRQQDCSLQPSSPPDHPPGPPERPERLVGIHTTLTFIGEADWRRQVVAAIDALGVQVARVQLLWHQVEAEQGVLNWTRTDAVVDELRAAGIEVLLVPHGSPSWANGVPATQLRHYEYVPQDDATFDRWLDRYEDFVAAAAIRYRQKVRLWEVWNEPNLESFWRPTPDADRYSRLYRRVYQAVLREHPDAAVAVGGLGRLVRPQGEDIAGLDFLRRVVDRGVPIDHVAIHPYTTLSRGPDEYVEGDNNFSDIQRVRDFLAERGLDVPLWVTEWGWSSEFVGEARQASYVERSMELLRSVYTYVTVAVYFVDYDRPPRTHFGLLDHELRPKPAADAYRRGLSSFTAATGADGQLSFGAAVGMGYGSASRIRSGVQ